MLPTALVTLVTFVLDLATSSPVYNMQPAFITTNIGSTNGRNIRNLPCISRKNNGLSGVCMFAIDCLKANGTHLGTCIDRFYFGSCCHIEPIKHETNSIETNIILDSREPPERIHNTTQLLSTTTQTSFSSSSNLQQNPSKLSQESKKPLLSTTTISPLTLSSITASTRPTTKQPSSTEPTPSLKPFSDKLANSTSTTEPTTTPQKLQTFQIIDGAPLETTTIKVVPSTTSQRPQVPVRTSTKLPSTTTKPRPAITAPQRPYQKPTSSTVKPTQKPVKVTATTKRPSTTNKATTTKKPATTKPTRRVTKPSISTAKPSTKIPTTARTTTSKIPFSTITRATPSTTTTKITKPPSTKRPIKPAASTVGATVSTTSKPLSTSLKPVEELVPKKNLTQILESGTANPATNEIIESGLLAFVNGTISTEKPMEPTKNQNASTMLTEDFSTVSTSMKPLVSSTQAPNISDVTTSIKPLTEGGLSTWNVDEFKNQTTLFSTTEPMVSDNVTEGWVPITTSDKWVQLPSVTPSTPNLTTLTAPSSTFVTFASEMTTQSNTVTLNQTLAAENVTTEITSTEFAATEVQNETSTTEITNEIKPINMTDFTDVCGRRMWPEARIVGGEKSTFGKWPWQISLRQWRTSTYLHKCGAALLNENWAITAAHCVDNVPPSDLLLRLGEHDLSTETEPYLHEERRVQIVASHPQFDPRTFEYDLALLRFYEPVQFQPNIIPVCVPKSDENFVGRTAFVTGWGRLYEDGPLPSVLQEVSVPVINNSVCESMYRSAGYIEHIPHIFICAGWRKGGFDSCEGDSGGPMVIQREDKRFLLSGVISWGIGCAEPNQPGVYTRISEFRDWINQILQF